MVSQQYADYAACVPMKLDAFVLNPAVASDEDSIVKIAPITQPNYTFLRLDNSVIQNDVLDPTDLHWATPASNNSRVSDLGKMPPDNLLAKRFGVYLSWTLPRVYRSGTAATQKASSEDKRVKQG
jgi:hypothetical protein